VERGARIHRVELDEGEPLPQSLDGFDAVIAMGGPMSVNDESEHPWLAPEKALLREAVASGMPVWGSCLGVQLLASALGAPVRQGTTPEVGVLPVEPTDEGGTDPVLGPCRWPLTTLQWHSDTFELPPGAVLLARSPAYESQAVRFAPLAYGVQFHVEVGGELADEWARVPAYVKAADDVLGEGGADRLLADVRASASEMLPEARGLFGRWMDLWVSRVRAAA
jgi:GMP synthase-like glutamine amidotransferase